MVGEWRTFRMDVCKARQLTKCQRAHQYDGDVIPTGLAMVIRVWERSHTGMQDDKTLTPRCTPSATWQGWTLHWDGARCKGMATPEETLSSCDSRRTLTGHRDVTSDRYADGRQAHSSIRGTSGITGLHPVARYGPLEMAPRCRLWMAKWTPTTARCFVQADAIHLSWVHAGASQAVFALHTTWRRSQVTRQAPLLSPLVRKERSCTSTLDVGVRCTGL